MNELQAIYEFFREGGFLALFLASAWLNLRQYRQRELTAVTTAAALAALHSQHQKETQDLNSQTLAGLKEARIHERKHSEKQQAEVIALFERMTANVAALAEIKKRRRE